MKGFDLKLKKTLAEIKRNVLLKNYTTFKIGGPARYFFEAKTKKGLVKAIKTAKELKLPFFILGGGSNLLLADKGYKGVVIKIKNQKSKIKNSIIYTEAGVPLSQLINLAAKNSLAGLEWAIGIPGTVGGAIYGNAGAFGSSMKDFVERVEIFDVEKEKLKIFKNKDCKFFYRDSIFKRNKNLVILSATLGFKKIKKKEIKEKIKECFDYRKKSQPLDFPSAGSIFKNPTGLLAGELIEKCGLKGKRIGNVKISEKHSNFIVNLGEGKAKDVKKLINLAKRQVKKKFGIDLEEEIELL